MENDVGAVDIELIDHYFPKRVTIKEEVRSLSSKKIIKLTLLNFRIEVS